MQKSAGRMLAFADWPPSLLASSAAPTLVMVGDRDVIRPEHAVEMYRLLPHAQLAIVPNTEHMALPLRADLVAPLLPPFLDA